MSTKTLTRKQALKNYILNNIDTTGHNVPTPTTDKEKIKFLIDTFRSEYVYKGISNQYVFANWLRGLPSVIELPIYYYDIEQQGKEFNFIKENQSRKVIDNFTQNYYNLVYICVLELANKYDLQNLLIDYSDIKKN